MSLHEGWINVLDAPSCYERVAQAERKFRIVGPYAQRRVTLMPKAIELARDALLNDWRESAACFERPAEQALATEPRAKRKARSVLCHTCQ